MRGLIEFPESVQGSGDVLMHLSTFLFLTTEGERRIVSRVHNKKPALSTIKYLLLMTQLWSQFCLKDMEKRVFMGLVVSKQISNNRLKKQWKFQFSKILRYYWRVLLWQEEILKRLYQITYFQHHPSTMKRTEGKCIFRCFQIHHIWKLLILLLLGALEQKQQVSELGIMVVNKVGVVTVFYAFRFTVMAHLPGRYTCRYLFG